MEKTRDIVAAKLLSPTQLFNLVLTQIRKSKQIEDDHLVLLHHIFPRDFQKALQIGETKVTKVVAPTDSFFRVAGTQQFDYLVRTETPWFCTCRAFNDRLASSESTVCKHVIASAIFDATGSVEQQHLSDAECARLCVGLLFAQETGDTNRQFTQQLASSRAADTPEPDRFVFG
ncbi:MAG: hypothetical protein MHM6MM_002735 [Cercozoa sp. M6MM]